MPGLFTAPDLSDPMDLFVTAFLATFSVTSLSGLLGIQAPLLNRSSGLMSYSKFANDVKSSFEVPSRLGMMLLYAPAGIIGAYFFQKRAAELETPLTESVSLALTDRTALCCALQIAHFGKRTLECLFLHKYSGKMPILSSGFIGFAYNTVAFVVCTYAAKVQAPLGGNVLDLSNQNANLVRIGLGLFALGLAGNFYHHYLLANLRKGPASAATSKAYILPTGGLFGLVATPHYFFEVIGWIGVACVMQHMFAALTAVAMGLYLADRATAQTAWNRNKFQEKYPKSRKHIIPFIF